MPRDLILGTAGHIDHGKTALVKALTGVDCDRLPEEKARGITIDIGFARLQVGELRIGIVDCPGHERFIRNMLAGSTGIDLAMLIVAADDSVMPQTREHLEILKLLGLRHGVIVITKADLVDETTRGVVELDLRELVRNSFLESAPIVVTSAHTGLGIEALRQAIAEAGSKVVRRDGSEWFRMAVDRSFVIQGHGSVVTGSITSGTIHAGDEVEWQPRGERVRARSLQNHDQSVESLTRGQRGAVNLAGINNRDVERGQEIATPGYLIPSKVLTLRLQALPGIRKPIKHRNDVRLHIGTAEVIGTLSLLDCDSIEAGKWGLVQIFLDEFVTAVWGQPFVVRDSPAEFTLGGGQVLQPVALKIRRRHIEVLERIEQLALADPVKRVDVVAWFAGFTGFTTVDVVRGAGVGPDEVAVIEQQLIQSERIAEVHGSGLRRVLHVDRLGEIEQKILDQVGEMHQASPLLTSIDRQKALSQLAYVGDDVVLQGVTDRLIASRMLSGDAKRIARTDFKPKLTANQRKLKDQIVEATRVAGFQPPEPESFAGKAGGNAGSLKEIFDVAIAEGHLCKVNEEIFLHSETDAEMRRRIAGKLNEVPGLTVAEIRDLLGTTRKYAVPLCEYLDRQGVTRREGDLRKLR
jgi:selenocysteine-specific elongation factor